MTGGGEYIHGGIADRLEYRSPRDVGIGCFGPSWHPQSVIDLIGLLLLEPGCVVLGVSLREHCVPRRR